MCIGRMEEIIDLEKERLKALRKKEDAKKQEVIGAKVDSGKGRRDVCGGICVQYLASAEKTAQRVGKTVQVRLSRCKKVVIK